MTRIQRPARLMPAEPRLRRAYFDCRYGQLHMHYAMPAGGGFDEATTLLCLPGGSGSGRFFQPLLAPLAQDRSVYAPDLPGCGESDPAPGAGPEELAAAMTDFLDSMHIRRVDLLAHDSGTAVALALLRQRPTLVGRAVLSPDSPVLRAQAQALQHPVLVIDLSPVQAAQGAQLASQALALREFLGLA